MQTFRQEVTVIYETLRSSPATRKLQKLYEVCAGIKLKPLG